MTEFHSKFLSVNLHGVSTGNMGKSTSLYPHHSVNISVLFVYGIDSNRQINGTLFKNLKMFIFNWCSLTVVFGTIFLYLMRRMNQLRRTGFISVLIDVMVIFIGGGHLRMNHKLERLLFSIISIAAIFLNGICLDSNLFPFYLLSETTVDTFSQLAEINPPVYFSFLFQRNQNLISGMLR